MDSVDCAPKCLLGWPIKTKTQIWFNWIVPTALELFVYVTLIVADVAVTYQHFIDDNHLWAGLTLAFVWLPAILCFGTIITSPWNWPDYYDKNVPETDNGVNKQCLQSILVLAFNVLLFPVGALARFGRRLFWSIEALFHDKDSYERHHSLSKAAETSAFELYHFLQAFTQAAPQLLLQLSILLREDLFRNYETSMLQAISIVFSLLQMAIIAESYQRFESQKIVGRNYPWHPAELCQERKELLQRRTEAATPRKPRSSAVTTVMEFPDEMRGLNGNPPEVAATARSSSRWSSASSTTSLAAGQLPLHSVTVEDARKTLHVDENNFDVQEKSLSGKRSLEAYRSKELPGWDDIEIDGHAGPITDRKALPAAVDKIKLLQSTPEHRPDASLLISPGEGEDGEDEGEDEENLRQSSTSPATAAAGEPKTINVDANIPTEQQLSKDHPHDRLYRRRPSYLARDAIGPLANDHIDGDDDEDNVHDYNFDTSPTSPPPPLPTSLLSPFNKILNYPLNRLSTITDMLLLDTELFVKDNVPRLPEKIANHEFKSHLVAEAARRGGDKNSLIGGDDVVEKSMTIRPHPFVLNRTIEEERNPVAAQDEVDFNVLMMPRRRKMVVGLEQEDFFAKTVAFLGWYFFIMMRVLAISVFATLHWREAIYICLGHYVVMLGCLLVESKFHPKMPRLIFYFFLSYVYVFVIMEFKIKFVHLRMWYGLFVGFVLTQNFALSVWWYTVVWELDLWWFDYLFTTILASGALSLCCLVVYYLRLKPKDKVLFELMEEDAEEEGQ